MLNQLRSAASLHNRFIDRRICSSAKQSKIAAARSNYLPAGERPDAGFRLWRFHLPVQTGIDAIARFDAHVEVYTPQQVIRVEYDTRYVRHQLARLSLTSANTSHGVTENRGRTARRRLRCRVEAVS